MKEETRSLVKEEVGMSIFIPVGFTMTEHWMLPYCSIIFTQQSSCILIPVHNGQVSDMDNTNQRIKPVGILEKVLKWICRVKASNTI